MMMILGMGSKDGTGERTSEEICSDPLQAADVEDINWNQTALMIVESCSKGIKAISA